MKGLQYLDKEVLELVFRKNMEEEQELDIEVAVAYRLDIDEEEKLAFGDAQIEISDETQTMLELKVHAVGVFSFLGDVKTDDDRMELHNATLKEFTPHLNGLVAQLSAVAEVPPVPITYEDFAGGEVEIESFTESLN